MKHHFFALGILVLALSSVALTTGYFDSETSNTLTGMTIANTVENTKEDAIIGAVILIGAAVFLGLVYRRMTRLY